jgi:hypothetical protein
LPDTPVSPHIEPRELSGCTPQQIDRIARQAGLIPRGPDPMNGKGAYVDPVSGKQRVLIHPHANEYHINNADGERLDIDGNIVDPKSPLAHLPLRTAP